MILLIIDALQKLINTIDLVLASKIYVIQDFLRVSWAISILILTNYYNIGLDKLSGHKCCGRLELNPGL